MTQQSRGNAAPAHYRDGPRLRKRRQSAMAETREPAASCELCGRQAYPKCSGSYAGHANSGSDVSLTFCGFQLYGSAGHRRLRRTSS